MKNSGGGWWWWRWFEVKKKEEKRKKSGELLLKIIHTHFQSEHVHRALHSVNIVFVVISTSLLSVPLWNAKFKALYSILPLAIATWGVKLDPLLNLRMEDWLALVESSNRNSHQSGEAKSDEGTLHVNYLRIPT